MGPRGATVKAIQQLRGEHKKVAIKLHDESVPSRDQLRRLELRGPSRHHLQAVGFDFDLMLKEAGISDLPVLTWME
jgi:hypothetical protein